MLVLVDMDGVIADFDERFLKLYGKTAAEMTGTELGRFWDAECVASRFFASLSPIQEGLDLVSALQRQRLAVSFLTSTGGGLQHFDIAKQKLDFLWRLGLGDFPVTFVTGSEDKASFAKPGMFLVDDRHKVVETFRKRGGVAYLFTRDNWQWILQDLQQQA